MKYREVCIGDGTNWVIFGEDRLTFEGSGSDGVGASMAELWFQYEDLDQLIELLEEARREWKSDSQEL